MTSVFILVSGIILFLFPFLSILLFSDRMKGVLVVSISLIGFAIFVPVFTQVLHIFGYFSVCSLYATLDLVVLLLLIRKEKFFSGTKFPVLFIIAVAIVSFELYSLHYHYGGQVQTINGQSAVSNDSYPYPIFSDEWVEAAMASYSIHTQALPIMNPLAENAPMPNLLLPFSSLLAGLFVLLGQSPVSNFAILAIIFGIAVCASIYMTARCFGAGKFASAIVMLSIPYIANGANLPGLWFLLPYIASAVPFFLMLACLGKKEYVLAGVSAFISLLLYPPFAIFILPAIVVGAFFTEKRAFISWPFAVAAVLGIVFLILKQNPSAAFSFIQKAVFHPSLDSGIPSYVIWNVIPIFMTPFIFLGIADLWRRKAFIVIAPAFVGLVYWILYAFYPNVILIEYPRIVVITSFILLLTAAFGLDFFFRYVSQYYISNHSSDERQKIKRIFVIGTTAIFAVAAVWYPYDKAWQTFYLSVKNGQNTSIIMPNLPLNRYISPDDLIIWRGISGKNFTAPPWKGLVIGAATGNFPLESKSSTITMSIMPYEKFLSADCTEKTTLAERYFISYAYSPTFKCPGFVELGESSERLHLYKYNAL